MRIGLGLPNATLGIDDGRLLVALARRAEKLGFSSLGTIGRIAYPGYEELITLAAAAGATERIGLFTDVLLGPAREAVLLAKQAATLDRISGGRLVLGLGVGAREDDFTVGGHDFRTRGKRWDAALDLMHRAWRGEAVPGSEREITVAPLRGAVPILFGGGAEQNLARIVRFGNGYTQGGGTPEALAEMRDRVGAAWQDAGRPGEPELRALSYFVLGGRASQTIAEANVRDYYGAYGERVWAAVAKDQQTLTDRVKAYEAAGCQELLFFLTVPALDQAERLAEAVLKS